MKKNFYKAFYLGCLRAGDSSDVDAIHLYAKDGPKSEGCRWEFEIALAQFRHGNYAMQARVFSDAWAVFQECPEVFAILSGMNDCFREKWGRDTKPFDHLVGELEKAGWKNEGRKQPRFVRHCGECGQDVVMSDRQGKHP